MGMFDALRGRLSDDTSSVSAPSISTPELESGDRAGAVDIASTSAAAAGIELPAGERLYNPYEGFAAAVDGRGMRGQYRLPAQVRRIEKSVGSGQMMMMPKDALESRFACALCLAFPRSSPSCCVPKRSNRCTAVF